MGAASRSRSLYRLLRPLLFRLDPELTHALSLNLLRLVGVLPPLSWTVRRTLSVGRSRPVEAFGLTFANAVGLAFHEAFGYEVVGVQRDIGYLDGRWEDVVVLQKVLDEVRPGSV